MTCEMDKPEACFNCPYSDCMDTSIKTSIGEAECLKLSGINSMPRKKKSNRKLTVEREKDERVYNLA